MSFVFSGVQVASFAAAAFCTLVLPVVLLIVLAVMKKIRLAPLALGFVSFSSARWCCASPFCSCSAPPAR